MRLPNILRSVAAILAGILVGGVLSSVTDALLEQTGLVPNIQDQMTHGSPWWFLVLAVLYRTIYTVFSGYVGAWIAPSHPILHAKILATLALIANAAGGIAMWSLGQHWYPFLLTIFAFPAAYWGGKLYIENTSHRS